MPGQGVPSSPCPGDDRDRINVLYILLSLPALGCQHQGTCLVMMVYTCQAFLSSQARNVLWICRKIVLCFPCPSGTNAAAQGKAVLQPLGG